VPYVVRSASTVLTERAEARKLHKNRSAKYVARKENNVREFCEQTRAECDERLLAAAARRAELQALAMQPRGEDLATRIERYKRAKQWFEIAIVANGVVQLVRCGVLHALRKGGPRLICSIVGRRRSTRLMSGADLPLAVSDGSASLAPCAIKPSTTGWGKLRNVVKQPCKTTLRRIAGLDSTASMEIARRVEASARLDRWTTTIASTIKASDIKVHSLKKVFNQIRALTFSGVAVWKSWRHVLLVTHFLTRLRDTPRRKRYYGIVLADFCSKAAGVDKLRMMVRKYYRSVLQLQRAFRAFESRCFAGYVKIEEAWITVEESVLMQRYATAERSDLRAGQEHLESISKARLQEAQKLKRSLNQRRQKLRKQLRSSDISTLPGNWKLLPIVIRAMCALDIVARLWLLYKDTLKDFDAEMEQFTNELEVWRDIDQAIRLLDTDGTGRNQAPLPCAPTNPQFEMKLDVKMMRCLVDRLTLWFDEHEQDLKEVIIVSGKLNWPRLSAFRRWDAARKAKHQLPRISELIHDFVDEVVQPPTEASSLAKRRPQESSPRFVRSRTLTSTSWGTTSPKNNKPRPSLLLPSAPLY
jgi:hypothetical protein